MQANVQIEVQEWRGDKRGKAEQEKRQKSGTSWAEIEVKA
jgi:hypothetical protein